MPVPSQLEELASLLFVPRHSIAQGNGSCTIKGIDEVVMGMLVQLSDQLGKLLQQADISASLVYRAAQDGLWRAAPCCEGSKQVDRRPQLEYRLTFPADQVSQLTRVLTRNASDHPQALTPMGFEVDFKMKGIITLLNEHGFTTSNSCQDNHGYMWIEFEDAPIYCDFVEACYRRDKAWVSRFLASEDRCKTSTSISVDALHDDDRKCESSEVTSARPHRVSEVAVSVRVPLQYFHEFVFGVFAIFEGQPKPLRQHVRALQPFETPQQDDGSSGGSSEDRSSGAIEADGGDGASAASATANGTAGEAGGVTAAGAAAFNGSSSNGSSSSSNSSGNGGGAACCNGEGSSAAHHPGNAVGATPEQQHQGGGDARAAPGDACGAHVQGAAADAEGSSSQQRHDQGAANDRDPSRASPAVGSGSRGSSGAGVAGTAAAPAPAQPAAAAGVAGREEEAAAAAPPAPGTQYLVVSFDFGASSYVELHALTQQRARAEAVYEAVAARSAARRQQLAAGGGDLGEVPHVLVDLLQVPPDFELPLDTPRGHVLFWPQQELSEHGVRRLRTNNN